MDEEDVRAVMADALSPVLKAIAVTVALASEQPPAKMSQSLTQLYDLGGFHGEIAQLFVRDVIQLLDMHPAAKPRSGRSKRRPAAE